MSNQRNQQNEKPLDYGIHPFNHLISSKIGSGKTYYLINLITTRYLNEFERIYVFCPTMNRDSKWNKLDILNSQKKLLKKSQKDNQYRESEYIKYTNEDEYPKKLKELYEYYIHYDQEYDPDLNDWRPLSDTISEPPKTLIIMDDISGIKCMTRSETIEKLIRQSRHYNISLIYSIQDIHTISPSVRNNARLITLFRTFNSEELDKIYDCFTIPCSRKQFKDVLFEIFEYYEEFGNLTKLDRPIVLFNAQNKSMKHVVMLLDNGYINFK